MSPRAALAAFSLLALAACAPPARDNGPCEPSCGARTCGGDGCGGSCGACPESAPFCTGAGVCSACQPSCADKQCGDDGCGGICGACTGGKSCSAAGLCFVPGSSCDEGCPAGTYCNGTQGCIAGCLRDDHCRPGQRCELSTHQCAARPELCNDQDDDGDGLIDEDFPQKGRACDGPDGDSCATGTWQCDGSGLSCVGDVNHPEVCNGKDDDCDGEIDEDFSHLSEACDGPDADTCKNGKIQCTQDGRAIECVGDQARAEVCNGIDDDCDGKTDSALVSVPLTLTGMTSIAASEFRADGSYTLVARTGQSSTTFGAQLWTGSRTGSPVAGPTKSGYVSAAAVQDGKVIVLLSDGAVWWGTPGAMQQATLPASAFAEAIYRDMGGSVGFSGGVPFVSWVAEIRASGSTSSQVQRVMFSLQGSTWSGTSLYKHTYMGGNVDRGGFVALPNGNVLGVVRDEWNNNAFQGMDIRCDWVARSSGTWRLGTSHSMCDPASSVVQANGRAYAVTAKWGGDPDTLRSTADGQSVTTLSWPLTASDSAPDLRADEQGRVHLLTREKNSTSATPLRDRLVAGGSTQVKALRTSASQQTFFTWGAVGDELAFVLYDTTTWNAPATNVRLVRELVCH